MFQNFLENCEVEIYLKILARKKLTKVTESVVVSLGQKFNLMKGINLTITMNYSRKS